MRSLHCTPAIPPERCAFYDLDLNAWSDAGTELLPSFEAGTLRVERADRRSVSRLGIVGALILRIGVRGPLD